jgi:hypothetical protein
MPRKKRLKSIARRELYERIWAKGVYRLAKELGVSGPGLLKVCRRHDIPTPPMGYWTKVAHGKPVSRPLLPIDEKYSTAEFPVVLAPARRKSGAAGFYDANLGRLAQEESKRARIIVPATSLTPHEAIDRTRTALEAAAQLTCFRRRSLLYPHDVPGEPMLDVSVSEPMVHRALAVLDSLLKACAERGYPLVPAENARERGLRILAMGEYFYARIRELCKRSPRDLTAAEAAQLCRIPCAFLPEVVVFAPTGMPQLDVGRYLSPDVVIRDTPYRRVEDGLNRVMMAMLRCVDEKCNKLAAGRCRQAIHSDDPDRVHEPLDTRR